MSLQIVLGLAALRLHERGIDRPVRMIWSREESIRGHHKRHEAVVRTKWGATNEGKITAVSAEVFMNSGAYAYTSTKVLGNFHLMVTGPYEIPNAHIDSYAITTNNVPGGAFRGFGGPQGAFAAENQMNKLAEMLGIDPVELRLKNILTDGSLLTVQTPMPKGVSLTEVIETCAERVGWKDEQLTVNSEQLTVNSGQFSSVQSLISDPQSLKRGRGFACSFKNVGFSFGAPERCEAIIELHGNTEIEKVILRHGAAEVGQGSHTALKQMAATAVGVDVALVEIDMSDTASSGNSGSVSASRMTFMAGNSIRQAAEKALEKWRNEERPAIANETYWPPKTQPYDPGETGVCMPNFAYGYVAEAVELTVDVETGHIRIDRVVCANDVGKAINPMLVQGQIEGAVVQAHGYALMENLQLKDGRILNPYLSQYLIPGIKDIPTHVESIIMEVPNPIGPWGARGTAETPFCRWLRLSSPPCMMPRASGDEIPLTPYKVVAKTARVWHWGIKRLKIEDHTGWSKCQSLIFNI